MTALEQRDCRHDSSPPWLHPSPTVCLRFDLSYRDIEELLAERGIDVDHVTLYRWVLRSRRSWPLGRADIALQIAGGWTRRT